MDRRSKKIWENDWFPWVSIHPQVKFHPKKQPTRWAPSAKLRKGWPQSPFWILPWITLGAKNFREMLLDAGWITSMFFWSKNHGEKKLRLNPKILRPIDPGKLVTGGLGLLVRFQYRKQLTDWWEMDILEIKQLLRSSQLVGQTQTLIKTSVSSKNNPTSWWMGIVYLFFACETHTYTHTHVNPIQLERIRLGGFHPIPLGCKPP